MEVPHAAMMCLKYEVNNILILVCVKHLFLTVRVLKRSTRRNYFILVERSTVCVRTATFGCGCSVATVYMSTYNVYIYR